MAELRTVLAVLLANFRHAMLRQDVYILANTCMPAVLPGLRTIALTDSNMQKLSEWPCMSELSSIGVLCKLSRLRAQFACYSCPQLLQRSHLLS